MIDIRSSTNTQRLLIRDFGTCLKFNGTSDVVAATTLSSFGSTYLASTFTISFWIKTGSTTQDIICGEANNTGGANPTAFWVRLNSDSSHTLTQGYLGVFVRSQDAKNYKFASTSSLNINDNKWHFVAIVITPSTNTALLYFDGASVSITASLSESPSTFSNFEFPFAIGAVNFKGTNGTFFNGYLDKFRLYTTGLSSLEVLNAYLTAPPTSNIFLSYEFDEGSGSSTTDASGNGFTGTITGATYSSLVAFKPRNAVTNKFLVRDMGTCLKFASNTTDRIDVAQTSGLPVTASTTFTLSFWSYIRDFSVGTYFFSEANSTNAIQIIAFHIGTAGKMNCFNKNDANTGGDQAGTVDFLKAGVWQHITITSNAGAVKVYCNGVDTTQTFALQATPYTFNLTTWGCLKRNTTAGSHTGSLDECISWSRALSSTEVSDLYYKGIVPTSGLVTYHKLDEGSGTTATDSSGLGNTGTITGAAYSTIVPLKSRTVI